MIYFHYEHLILPDGKLVGMIQHDQIPSCGQILVTGVNVHKIFVLCFFPLVLGSMYKNFCTMIFNFGGVYMVLLYSLSVSSFHLFFYNLGYQEWLLIKKCKSIELVVIMHYTKFIKLQFLLLVNCGIKKTLKPLSFFTYITFCHIMHWSFELNSYMLCMHRYLYTHIQCSAIELNSYILTVFITHRSFSKISH